MDSQEVGKLLKACLTAAKEAEKSSQPTEKERLDYCSCKDLLCEELASLLQDAIEMKWPFVPEKWQYKRSVLANDKTNLSDLISKHLSLLLAVLKASITAQEARTALSVIFLVDRFLYWTDDSSQLLKITKRLYKHHPGTPVAPQLVIRQARVYLNSGKLQKAEYILSSLINNKGATGCWTYHSESDQALVQAVSVQVRGMILQKLGLWLEAAELIWASLVGYYALPQPDKKGIGTSLGILANILVSMNDEDFDTFRKNPDIDLKSLLGDVSHRLLSAAQAAKMAVVYSQYTSLYVLTNVTAQGTCLLSYSFSVQCPTSQKKFFFQEAKEAFEIGLLTKAEGELVTSQQELHTFIKAAYSLTVTHKWLGSTQEVITQSMQACQKALATFYNYCQDKTPNKDGLCAEIMRLIAKVKEVLQVKPFLNSDKGSFIPDSYRNITDTGVSFTLEDFAKVMQKFRKYHESLCETADLSREEAGVKMDGAKLCLTLWTTVGDPSNDCHTEACSESNDAPKEEEPQQRGSKASSEPADMATTLEDTDDLGSSWHKISTSSSGSPRSNNNINYTGRAAIEDAADTNSQSCLTTEADEDDVSESAERNRKQRLQGCNSVVGSHPVPIPVTSPNNNNPVRFEMSQAEMETLDSKDLLTDDVGVPLKPSGSEGVLQSLSELVLKTSSSSLGDSFGSQSSWEKISLGPNSPTSRKPQPHSISKTGAVQVSNTPESSKSFFHLKSPDNERSDSALGSTDKTHKSETSSNPRPLNSSRTDPGKDTKVDSFKPAANNVLPNSTPQHSQFLADQSDSTEESTESSFEMLEENHSENINVPQSLFCYSCLKFSNAVVPERQYELSVQDYQALLAGVCHGCLLKRLQSSKTEFKLKDEDTEKTHCALHLKFSKATGLWTARETCVHIGETMVMKVKGSQRRAIKVQFLHQEERLSSYVGKDYLKPKAIQFHLKDVERQMTAQYYVTEFNKSLYDREVMAQIFFIPSDALLILDGNEIVGCVTVEPFMLGDFVKLTNNARKKEMKFKATEFGLAFGHFTYLFSDCHEVVVDLQGWVTANGKGLTYLTDPQIHSIKTPKGPSNFAAGGLKAFLEGQHGPECNEICKVLKLPSVVIPQPHSE